MKKIEDKFFRNLLFHSGVEVFNISTDYDECWRALKNVFLTNENKHWFEEKYKKYKKSIEGCTFKYQTTINPQRGEWTFWELFSFGRLPAECGDQAICSFNNISVNECYVLQAPNYVDVAQLFYMKGAYDVSYIDTLEEFNFIKTDVRKDVSIPFWAVYSLYERYGNEFYAFDKKLTWILALTHENEIYLYIPLKQGK